MNPLILLGGDKPAAAILAGVHIPLFFPVADAADNIEIDLEAVTFTTVGTEFFRNVAPPFESPVFSEGRPKRHPEDEGP